MGSEKYLALRPWHFAKGADFSLVEFRDMQYRLQRRYDNRWLHLTLLLPPLWLILFLAVLLPQKRDADRAMERLGIAGELKDAETHLAEGTAAYEPSREQLDAWQEMEEEEDRMASEAAWKKQSPAYQRKLLVIWSVILLAVAVVILLFGLFRGANNGWQITDVLPLVLGTAVFGGTGIYALVRSLR